MSELSVIRFDRGQMLRRPYRGQGRLRFDGVATRVGVFEYYDAKTGTIRRELRHPDQVFHPKSLKSIGGAPLTLKHPPGLVRNNDALWRDYGAGTVGDAIDVSDNEYVKVLGSSLVRGDAIAAVEKGTDQLSLGYLCRVAEESGVWNGVSYTHRQYGIPHEDGDEWIDIDHLAIVDAARAGPNARINLDGLDELTTAFAYQMDYLEPPQPIQLMTTPKETPPEVKPMVTLKIDSDTSIEVEPHVHANVIARFKSDEKAIATLESENKQLKADTTSAQEVVVAHKAIQQKLSDRKFDSIEAVFAELDKQQARADQKDEEVAKLKAEASTKLDSADLLPMVRARAALERTAEPLLPKEFKADEASDRQIMEQSIAAKTNLKKFDGLSDEYVKARFDALVESFDSTTDLRRASEETKTTPKDEITTHVDEAEQARNEWIKELTGAKV